MFTWHELVGMGVRRKGYWLRQAEAIKRQYIGTVSYAIGLAMADGPDREQALAELELVYTKQESKNMRSKAEWDMMFLLKGGKSV